MTLHLGLFTNRSRNLQTREAQYYASRAPQSNASMISMATQSQTPDISSLLKIINSQQQPQHVQQQPPQPTPAQSQPGGLEAIFAQFANGSGHQPPQAQMQAPTHQTTAQNGYNLQAALAAMNVANPAQPAYIPPPPSQQPNLQSILAQFGQQPAAPMQSYGYPNAYQIENDRKRQAEFDDAAGGEHGYGKSKRQKGEEKKVRTCNVPFFDQLTESMSFSTSGLHATLADSGWKANVERATAALTFTRKNPLDKRCRLSKRNPAGCSGSLNDHGWHSLRAPLSGISIGVLLSVEFPFVRYVVARVCMRFASVRLSDRRLRVCFKGIPSMGVLLHHSGVLPYSNLGAPRVVHFKYYLVLRFTPDTSSSFVATSSIF